MYKIIISAFSILISICGFSQIQFEPGYYLNNNGEKVHGLIKNLEWKDNPFQIDFKSDESDVIIILEIEDIKGFQIDGGPFYERFEVDIDRSSDVVDKLSTQKKPEFQTETLLLKQIVKGPANLYYFSESFFIRYFIKVDTRAIEQLVYKRYKTYDGMDLRMGENLYFRQQLLNMLKCSSISAQKLSNIDYNQRELSKVFNIYNQCIDPNYVIYEKEKDLSFIAIAIRPGMILNQLTGSNDFAQIKDFNFSFHPGFRLGLEMSFSLPFNQNRWAITLEPTYQRYQNETKEDFQSISTPVITLKTNYQSIELPVGLRFHHFYNDKLTLFANGSISFDFPINDSRITSNRKDQFDLEIKSRFNPSIGIGAMWSKKISTEFRYNFRRDLLRSYAFWGSNYQGASFILGYSLTK